MAVNNVTMSNIARLTPPLSEEQQREAQKEQAKSEFRAKGFGEELASAMVSDNEITRNVADVVSRGIQEGPYGAVNGAQINDLARVLFTQNADGTSKLSEAYQYFGEGTADFVNTVIQSHANAGASSQVFGTMLDIAKDFADSSGVYGQELASRIAAGYRNFGALALGTAQFDKKGVPVDFNSLNARQQLMFDSALRGTVASLRERGVSAAKLFEDPDIQQSFLRVMDATARSQALGVDLPRLLADNGTSFGRLAGDFVAGQITGSTTPGNKLDHIMGFLESFGNITGGNTVKSVNGRRSGDPSVYDGDPSALLTARTTSPGCDDLARRCLRGLLQTIAPEIAAGKTAQDALNEAFDVDPNGRGHALVAAVAAEMSGAIGGKFADRAALYVASEILTEFHRTGSANVQDIVNRLSLYDKELETIEPDVARTLRNWGRYNAVHAADISGMRRDLEAHFAKLVGDAGQAAGLASQVLEQVAEAERSGGNYLAPYRNAMEQAVIFEPYEDGKGAQFKDPDTGVPRWRRRIRNARVARIDLGKTEEEWADYQSKAAEDEDRHAKLVEELRKRAAALADYEARQRIKAQASESQDA